MNAMQYLLRKGFINCTIIASVNDIFNFDLSTNPRLMSDESYITLKDNKFYYGFNLYENNIELFFADRFQNTGYTFICIDRRTNIKSIYCRTDNIDIIKRIINYEYLNSSILRNHRKNINIRLCQTYGVQYPLFDNELFLYSDIDLSKYMEELISLASSQKIKLTIFDSNYAKEWSNINELKTSAFLSYSYSDKNIARNIAQEVMNSNNSCYIWFDEHQIIAGDNLYDKINHAIANTKIGILLISQDYLTNENWAKHEFQSLLNKKQFIPLVLNLEHTELPLYLQHIAYIRYGYNDWLSQLNRSILQKSIES